MAVLPAFLIKRVYKKGSLRKTDKGIEFDLKNVLGPGVISGLESIQINDYVFKKDVISFVTGGIELLATKVDELNPIQFRLNQEGTMKLSEQVNCIKEGLNKIILEIMNPEAGKLRIEFTDAI